MSPIFPDLPVPTSQPAALEMGQMSDEDSLTLLSIPLPDVMPVSFDDWAAAVEAFQR